MSNSPRLTDHGFMSESWLKIFDNLSPSDKVHILEQQLQSLRSIEHSRGNDASQRFHRALYDAIDTLRRNQNELFQEDGLSGIMGIQGSSAGNTRRPTCSIKQSGLGGFPPFYGNTSSGISDGNEITSKDFVSRSLFTIGAAIARSLPQDGNYLASLVPARYHFDTSSAGNNNNNNHPSSSLSPPSIPSASPTSTTPRGFPLSNKKHPHTHASHSTTSLSASSSSSSSSSPSTPPQPIVSIIHSRSSSSMGLPRPQPGSPFSYALATPTTIAHSSNNNLSSSSSPHQTLSPDGFMALSDCVHVYTVESDRCRRDGEHTRAFRGGHPLECDKGYSCFKCNSAPREYDEPASFSSLGSSSYGTRGNTGNDAHERIGFIHPHQITTDQGIVGHAVTNRESLYSILTQDDMKRLYGVYREGWYLCIVNLVVNNGTILCVTEVVLHYSASVQPPLEHAQIAANIVLYLHQQMRSAMLPYMTQTLRHASILHYNEQNTLLRSAIDMIQQVHDGPPSGDGREYDYGDHAASSHGTPIHSAKLIPRIMKAVYNLVPSERIALYMCEESGVVNLMQQRYKYNGDGMISEISPDSSTHDDEHRIPPPSPSASPSTPPPPTTTTPTPASQPQQQDCDNGAVSVPLPQATKEVAPSQSPSKPPATPLKHPHHPPAVPIPIPPRPSPATPHASLRGQGVRQQQHHHRTPPSTHNDNVLGIKTNIIGSEPSPRIGSYSNNTHPSDTGVRSPSLLRRPTSSSIAGHTAHHTASQSIMEELSSVSLDPSVVIPSSVLLNSTIDLQGGRMANQQQNSAGSQKAMGGNMGGIEMENSLDQPPTPSRTSASGPHSTNVVGLADDGGDDDDLSEKQLVCIVGADHSMLLRRVPWGQGVCGYVAATQCPRIDKIDEPRLVVDLGRDPLHWASTAQATQYYSTALRRMQTRPPFRPQHVLTVPIVDSHSNTIAVLQFFNKLPVPYTARCRGHTHTEFSDADQDKIIAIAPTIATALALSRLRQHAVQNDRKTRTLLGLLRLPPVSNNNWSILFSHMAEITREALSAEMVAIYLVEKGAPIKIARRYASPRVKARADEDLILYCAHHGIGVNLRDAQAQWRVRDTTSANRSVLCIPVQVQSETHSVKDAVGLIQVINKRRKRDVLVRPPPGADSMLNDPPSLGNGSNSHFNGATPIPYRGQQQQAFFPFPSNSKPQLVSPHAFHNNNYLNTFYNSVGGGNREDLRDTINSSIGAFAHYNTNPATVEHSPHQALPPSGGTNTNSKPVLGGGLASGPTGEGVTQINLNSPPEFTDDCSNTLRSSMSYRYDNVPANITSGFSSPSKQCMSCGSLSSQLCQCNVYDDGVENIQPFDQSDVEILIAISVHLSSTFSRSIFQVLFDSMTKQHAARYLDSDDDDDDGDSETPVTYEDATVYSLLSFYSKDHQINSSSANNVTSSGANNARMHRSRRMSIANPGLMHAGNPPVAPLANSSVSGGGGTVSNAAHQQQGAHINGGGVTSGPHAPHLAGPPHSLSTDTPTEVYGSSENTAKGAVIPPSTPSTAAIGPSSFSRRGSIITLAPLSIATPYQAQPQQQQQQQQQQPGHHGKDATGKDRKPMAPARTLPTTALGTTSDSVSLVGSTGSTSSVPGARYVIKNKNGRSALVLVDDQGHPLLKKADRQKHGTKKTDGDDTLPTTTVMGKARLLRESSLATTSANHEDQATPHTEQPSHANPPSPSGQDVSADGVEPPKIDQSSQPSSMKSSIFPTLQVPAPRPVSTHHKTLPASMKEGIAPHHEDVHPLPRHINVHSENTPTATTPSTTGTSSSLEIDISLLSAEHPSPWPAPHAPSPQITDIYPASSTAPDTLQIIQHVNSSGLQPTLRLSCPQHYASSFFSSNSRLKVDYKQFTPFSIPLPVDINMGWPLPMFTQEFDESDTDLNNLIHLSTVESLSESRHNEDSGDADHHHNSNSNSNSNTCDRNTDSSHSNISVPAQIPSGSLLTPPPHLTNSMSSHNLHIRTVVTTPNPSSSPPSPRGEAPSATMIPSSVSTSNLVASSGIDPNTHNTNPVAVCPVPDVRSSTSFVVAACFDPLERHLCSRNPLPQDGHAPRPERDDPLPYDSHSIDTHRHQDEARDDTDDVVNSTCGDSMSNGSLCGAGGYQHSAADSSSAGQYHHGLVLTAKSSGNHSGATSSLTGHDRGRDRSVVAGHIRSSSTCSTATLSRVASSDGRGIGIQYTQAGRNARTRILTSLFSPFTSSATQAALTPIHLASASIDHFSFNEVDLCVAIYNTLVFIGTLSHFQCHYTTLQSFIISTAALYRDNPFHNFIHGFNVFQFAYRMLVATGDPSLCLDDRLRGEGWIIPSFEASCLLIGALCHDLDHPGNTNAFEVHTQSPLAYLHNGTSVLEHHHVNVLSLLLEQPQTALFSNLPRSREIFAKRFLTRAILSTDMEYHMETYKKLGNGDLSQLDYSTPAKEAESTQFLANVIIHTADVSGQLYPIDIALLWEKVISEEFARQSCNEQRLGLTPLVFMLNLDKLYYRCKGQISFISHVLQPWWEELTRWFPSLAESSEILEANLAHYQDIVNKIELHNSIHAEANTNTAEVPDEDGGRTPEGSVGSGDEEQSSNVTTTRPTPPPPPPPMEDQFNPDGLCTQCEHEGEWVDVVCHHQRSALYSYIPADGEITDESSQIDEIFINYHNYDPETGTITVDHTHLVPSDGMKQPVDPSKLNVPTVCDKYSMKPRVQRVWKCQLSLPIIPRHYDQDTDGHTL